MKKIFLIVPGLLISAALLFLWLCRDETQVMVPTDIELYTEQPEGSEESYRILLEALREEPAYEELSHEFRSHDQEEEGYKDLLRHNSDLILQNHAISKVVLSELTALHGYEGIGDRSISFESEIVKFQSIRDLVLAICHYTELAYLEDLEDRSLDELLEIHAIASKWQPYSRTLVHSMICVTIHNRIRDTLFFIEPYLSPEEIQQVLAAYSDIPNYPRSVENALYSEYCMAADALDGILAEGNGLVAYVLFKRNRTLNIYGSYLEDLIASSRDQDWDTMSDRGSSLWNDLGKIDLTNWGGRTFLAMAIPAMNKVFKTAYEAQAEDLELVRQLQQASGTSANAGGR